MEAHYDYVLVGGGLASVWAAQNIRELDKAGKVVLIGDEPHPPYDRPPFSKNFLTNDEMTPDDGYSKYDDFYPKNNIELHTATRVQSIDRSGRRVSLENGTTFTYGKLLLATGSRARPLDLPGNGRPGVFYLRHIEDAIKIRQAMRASKRCVILGAGYIGIEVAADAQARGLEATVVEKEGHPWSRFASPELGRWLADYYETRGVKMIFGDQAAALEGAGDSGPIQTVLTEAGRRLAADFVVIAVGVDLNVEMARAAGLDVEDRDGVRVDEFLKTSDPNIWAAGDIAFFHDVAMNKHWHAEHFLNAKWQGQAAGKIMAGGDKPYDQVPYFFSDFLDLHMILRGDPQGGRNRVFTGDVNGAEFTELYYADDGRLTMGVSIGHDEKKLDPISDALERAIRANVNIKAKLAEVQAQGFDVASLA